MTKLLVKLFTVYMAIFLGICCVPIDYRASNSIIFSSDANATVNCTGTSCEHNDSSKFDREGDPGEDDNLLGVMFDYVMMLALGVATFGMIVACKVKSYSTWIFIISGICYILAEVLGQMNYKAAAEEALNFSLSNVEGYTYTSEIQRFQDAVEQTDEAIKAAEEKKGHLEAVKGGFLVGFIVNIIEAAYCSYPPKTTGICTPQACYANSLEIGPPNNPNIPPMLYAELINILRPVPSSSVILSQRPPQNIFDSALDSFGSLSEKIADFVLGKQAHAFMPPAQLAVNMGITAVWQFVLWATNTSIYYKKLVGNTYARLLAFVMAGLLATHVLSKLEIQIKKLEQRKTAYNEIIARINLALVPDATVPCPAGGVRTDGVCGMSDANIKRRQAKMQRHKIKKGKSGACLNQSGSVDPNCICKKNNSCHKMPSPPRVGPKFAGQIPADLNSLSQSVRDTGSALATGNLAKARSSSQIVSKSIGKLEKMKNTALANLIKKDKRFKKMEKNARTKLKNFRKSMYSKLNKKGQLAALQSATVNEPSVILPKAKEIIDKIPKKESVGSSGSGSKGSGKSGSDPLAGFEDQNEKEKEVDLFNDEDKSISKFDKVYDDISNKSDVSIWHQLSKRYLKKYNTFYEVDLTPIRRDWK